jgi:LPXTG-motif cell wall-anchored protein
MIILNPATGIDLPMLPAIIAAVLAVGALVFGIISKRRK